MRLFNILVKDINQLKKTGGELKRIERKTAERFPLFASITKSIFVIIKWLIIIFIVAATIFIVIKTIYYYTVELPAAKVQEKLQLQEREYQAIREERYQKCLDECDNSYPAVTATGLIMPGDPKGEILLEKRALRDNCLSDCKKANP